MDFAAIGRVGGYVRSLLMPNMNNLRGNSPERRSNRDSASFSAESRVAAQSASESPESGSPGEMSVSEMLEEQSKKLGELFADRGYDKPRDACLSGILAKMYCGRTLTPAEQSCLARHDPQGYESFQKMECARSVYRCTLASCRTRDEVNGMRLSNALSALSAYKKSVKNGGDGSAIVGLNAALNNEIREFTKTRNYHSLPTVAECDKFDRDIAKARKFEREKRIAERNSRLKGRKKQVKTPGDGKLTVRQVMSSPSAKKVLASRSKRVCTAYFSSSGFYGKI